MALSHHTWFAVLYEKTLIKSFVVGRFFIAILSIVGIFLVGVHCYAQILICAM
jgi:hypothetical protein